MMILSQKSLAVMMSGIRGYMLNRCRQSPDLPKTEDYQSYLMLVDTTGTMTYNPALDVT